MSNKLYAMNNPTDTNQASEDMSKPDNTQPIPASHEYDQAELVEAIMELNNMGDDWDAQHIGELVADWHNKQITKARINEVQNAYEHWIYGKKFISSYFKDRIAELSSGEEAEL